ncbi:hypothetical protein JMUB7531_29230 [Staphylococcus aureus]
MSRGLGDVYKRQVCSCFCITTAGVERPVSYTHLTLPTTERV